MKIPVFISFLFLVTVLNAQTIFPENGSWYQKYHSIAWGHGGEVLWDITTYSTYAINGELIVNDKRYLELYNNNVFESYIFVDSLRVFFGENIDSLRLLYDYSLNVGDSFQFYGPSYTNGNNLLNLEVISTDSILIGEEMRKRITFSDFAGYGTGPLWIQGIGDVNFGGIELDYSYVSWFANTTTLLCFIDNGINLFGNCVTSVPDIKAAPLFTPNPSEGPIQISFSNFSKPAHIRLFSSDGRLIYNSDCLNNSLDIDLSSKGRGLYFLEISDINKRAVEKVIIR